MVLSRFQRQILHNQHSILELLSKDEHDIKYHQMMKEVYYSGFEYEYFEHGVYDDDEILPEEHGRLVYKIINMYDELYYHWQNDEEISANIDEYYVQFPGFDLNHPEEHKYYSFAKFLIEDLGKFRETRELLERDKRYSLNSHGSGPGVEGYRLMLEKFELHNSNRIERGVSSAFTVEEINDIIKYR